MKKIRVALTCAVLACALTGCTSDQLKSEQKTERQALQAKQKSDRQVERAESSLVLSTAGTTAAKANLAAKKQAQKQADADLQQIICPQPSQ